MGFEPTISGSEDLRENDKIDWPLFREQLDKKYAKRNAAEIYNYAFRFKTCLLEKDFSEIRNASNGQRPHILKALSALAKFIGQYEIFLQLVKSHALKWCGRSADDLIIDRLTKVQDPGEVFEWIRQVKTARPDLVEFMDLIAISGLRFNESVFCYNLIIQLSREKKLDSYYNREKASLEHFQFKEIFLRPTKKAFVSFIPESLVNAIAECTELSSADCVQKMVVKAGLPCRFSDVRENHGTHLTKFLKENEINFLHGRLTTGVFQRNYFNAALLGDLKTRAFQGIAEIQAKIKID